MSCHLRSPSRFDWIQLLEAADHGLLAELKKRGGRLGTEMERPDDQREVERLAHDLRNKITTLQLRNALLAEFNPGI